MRERVSIQSFDWRSLQRVQQLEPNIRTVYLTIQTANNDNVRDPAWTAGIQLAEHGSVPRLVKAAGGEDKPVVVAETGWPGRGKPVAAAVPSAENAMKYFIDVQQWARGEGVKLFYFSSFDEPWKLQQEGEVGTQWGLWDKDGALKVG